jgi:hypothetical protein
LWWPFWKWWPLEIFQRESFKYNVFESELLFSEFYHSWHGFFTRVPPFNALPGMFLTLYSSIIIIQLMIR